MAATGEARAFGRGVRIALGFAVLLVIAVIIVVVERDRPLKRQTLPATQALPAQTMNRAAVQAAAPANASGGEVDPGKSTTDLVTHP